jgi:magnesium-transporting ATPase (P-type)
LERLGSRPDQRRHYDVTIQHLETFAKEGLRTLCLGVATISEADYAVWSKKMHEASTAISNREQLIEAAATHIETNLTLIGATAIEDRLQDQVSIIPILPIKYIERFIPSLFKKLP